MHDNTLDTTHTALVVVDVQEAFRTAIPDFDRLVSRIVTAVKGFQTLDVPVIVTEQYPKGLKRTAAEILELVGDEPRLIEKMTFSSCGADAFLATLTNLGARRIVLCGIEAHICVNQTAHDLLAMGYQVHLLSDCISSRYDYDRLAGIAKMERSGAIVSTTEMALFEMAATSEHECFKDIQQLVK
jgi:nicotinamidase-related amidase